MGYKPVPTLYNLKFVGTDFDGLEITFGSLSVAGCLKVESLFVAKKDEDNSAGSSALVELAAIMVKKIHLWNVEDETDSPIPVSVEALLDFEPPLFNVIVEQWITAMTGVSAPLDENSTTGETSLEESMQMAAS